MMETKMSVKALFAMGVVSAMAALSAADEPQQYAELWPNNPGVFAFVNCQSAISSAEVRDAVRFATGELCYKTEYVEGCLPAFSEVSVAIRKLGAKGALWIINDANYPVSLGAIEDEWAILNVAPILADDPSGKRRRERLIKYLSRLFATIHGANDSAMMPGCVMNPAIGLEGIDKLKCAIYSPEAVGKIQKYCELAGYKAGQVAPYLDACEEGWAPAPTNAVQKAIWDKVHALPTKPIKILPKNARDAKK